VGLRPRDERAERDVLSLGDEADTAEQDLWFLPGPDSEDEDAPPGAPPLPYAFRTHLFDLKIWREAQGDQSGELARLTQTFGELDARLREGSDGLRHRLALREITNLSWWIGDRLPQDRLGLWVALRIGSTAETEQALGQAGWAFRRLTAGPPAAQNLAAFLERPAAETEGSQVGADAGAIADLSDLLLQGETLHPVTQAAVLFHAWRMIGAPYSRDMEAAILAARHGATMSRRPGQGALFLPLSTTGPAAFRGSGDAALKLAAWIAGAEQATLGALLHIERLALWKSATRTALGDLSGRTAARLVEVFATWPLVAAPLAEAETGASRAAVQRNLDLLTERGLIREITGQGRYRVWTATT